MWAWRNVPLLGIIGPTVEQLDDEKCVISIPLRGLTRNHFNSMYLAVLTAGADLASGLMAFQLSKEGDTEVGVIFKDMKADFLKRAHSRTYFTCTEGKAIRQSMRKALRDGERVNRTVKVIATCPDTSGDEPVAQFRMTLSMKVRH